VPWGSLPLDPQASCPSQPFWSTSGPHLQSLAVGRSPRSCVYPGGGNADHIQEPFKLSWPGPVLDLVATRPLYVGGAGLVGLTHLLILLGVSIGVFVVKGRLLSQGTLVGDVQHLLGRPGVFHGELVDQRRVPESLLKEPDDGFVVDLRDDIPFVAEALYKFPEELSLLT
jgi:hypothetical protein